MSAHERSGWRDEKISRRHRLWGLNVPAVDIDWLVIEYDRCEPMALVEYKREDAQPIQADHPNLKAIRRLADRASLPAFVVRYGEDLDWFKARALNAKGREFISAIKTMTEPEYVVFLYSLRDRKAPVINLDSHRTARLERVPDEQLMTEWWDEQMKEMNFE